VKSTAKVGQTKGWTQADYESAGKKTVLLRLEKTAAKELEILSDSSGVSRQKIIETVLLSADLRRQILAAIRNDPNIQAGLKVPAKVLR